MTVPTSCVAFRLLRPENPHLRERRNRSSYWRTPFRWSIKRQIRWRRPGPALWMEVIPIGHARRSPADVRWAWHPAGSRDNGAESCPTGPYKRGHSEKLAPEHMPYRQAPPALVVANDSSNQKLVATFAAIAIEEANCAAVMTSFQVDEPVMNFSGTTTVSPGCK